jgi:hypothetical protein
MVLRAFSEEGDRMLLKTVRWLFATLAGIAASVVSVLGWMAASFGGPIVGYKDVASVVLPVICLPLFVLFLMKPKWGFYAFFLYLLSAWAIQVLISTPRILFNPLSSDMDKIILGCVCSVALSYGAYKRIGERKATLGAAEQQ